MAKIQQLSPEVIAELGEMKAYIDRMRRGGTPGAHEPSSKFREKQVRIARTTTGLDCSIYPVSSTNANTFVVELGSGDFDPSCGLHEHTFTPYLPSELRYAHATEYIAEGTTVIIVLIHDKWYILPLGIGSIAFTMNTDRTRELTAAGKSIGYAQAKIDDIAGSVPDDLDDEVQIVFTDKRWLGAVTGFADGVGCQGRADYIGGYYIVTECQELCSGFWGHTDEDRVAGPQDVKVKDVNELVGHNNGDFDPRLWKQNLVVRYQAGTYPRMRTNAIFYCEFDNDIENTTSNSGMRYSCIVSDQITMSIKGELQANNCQTGFVATAGTTLDQWPFSQDPEYPLSISNRHAGLSGDEWKARWNDDSQAYEVWDIDKHLKKLMTNFHQTQESGCITLQYDEQEAYVEVCKAPSVDQTIIAYKQTTVDHIDNLSVDITSTPTLVLDYTRHTVYAICTPGVPAEETLPLTKKTVIDECLRVACETGSGDESLEAHFADIYALYTVPGDWEACVAIVRCDGSSCSPATPPPDPPPEALLAEDEEEIPPPPSVGPLG